MMLIYTTFLFAVLKFKHMYEFKSPTINQFTQTLDEEATEAFFDTSKDSFMIAVGIDHFLDGIKDDPKFVQWVATYFRVDEDGNKFEDNYPMHRCSLEDFEKFYPPDHDTEIKIEKLKKNGGLYCIDLKEIKAELHGSWQTGTHYQALDFKAIPCGQQYQLSDGNLSEISKNCNWDQQAAVDYFGIIGLLIYFNEGVFQQEKFDEGRVLRQSFITTMTSLPKQSSWVQGFVDQFVLQDEIALLQLGVSEEIEFDRIRIETP